MTLQEDREQLFLELINRARLDPLAEGQLQGVADLSAGTGMVVTGAALQVLAYNAALYQSSTVHNQDMIRNNYFDHPGSDGSDAGGRMFTAGYGPKTAGGALTFGWGENLAWRGTSGVLNANAEVYNEHRDLFRSNDHRSNILDPSYEELGVSAITASGYQGYNALLTTHNFGFRPSAGVFVTGVNYTDRDGDDFYSIGESAAGRTVQLLRGVTVLGTTGTANAGGYQLQMANNAGAVEIVFSGADLASAKAATFTLGTLNVKFDLTDGNTIETNVSATLTRATQNLKLLSIDNVSGTGNEVANIITGNKGNNALDGAGGNDTLLGGGGDDTLTGGIGNDTIIGGAGTGDKAVFTGTLANYVITYNALSAAYTLYGNDGNVDTVTGVESFQFSDGTRTAAQLPLSAGAPTRALSITADNAQQTEGNAGSITYTFTVSLTGSAFTTQTVNFAIAGSGANAADVNDLSGLLSGTLTFLVGETSKTVSINVLGDTTVEQDETFTVTLSGQTSGLTLGTATATATILNDDVAGPNIVNGDDLDNSLLGTVGIDHMFGMAGNDRLGGSAGADILDGGTDNDTADYRNSTGGNVAISLLANTASGGDAQGDQLISIENLNGSLTQRDILIGDNNANVINGFGGNDSLRGEDGNDYLVGGAGADAISGGAGSQDWAGYRDNVSGSVNINLLANTYSGGDATGDTLFFIENLEGSLTLRDILIGNDVANIIIGNGGVDSVRGEGGNDVINGGAGADSLNAGAGIDTATYETSAVGVTVDLNITTQMSGGDANGDSLYFFENITGSGKDDSLHGNLVSNRLVGGAGLDTLDGGTGSDYLTGGADADVFRFADASFGADTITDWQDGTDHISIALPLETSFAGLSITGNGTRDVVVRGFNTSGTIIIHSDAAFTLDAGDFIFV